MSAEGCAYGCPDPYMCRDAGACWWEGEQRTQEEAHYRKQQEAGHYAETERLHWLELEGHCWAHAVHEQTCDECLTVARTMGLRQCDPVPRVARHRWWDHLPKPPEGATAHLLVYFRTGAVPFS